MEAWQYPIGKFSFQDVDFEKEFENKILEIVSFPRLLNMEVNPLPNEILDTPYRPGGWTVRQVVHHLADSHAQCLTRFKWALTEESPVIKTYHEALWANLADSIQGPIQPALLMLDGIHQRWGYLMKHMSAEDWSKSFFHPEKNRLISLKETLFLYVWHGKHHLAHIELAKNRLKF